MVLLDISKKGYIEKKERCNFMSGQIEIETIGLTKKFGGLTAVDNVDFVLHKGKLESIIGPNGAGKSTFFNMICGNLSPTKGKIILDDEEITGLSPNQIARKGIARTFQQTSIFLGMDVFENVRISVQLGYNNKIPIFLYQNI
ncbi:Vitamin B12 import ATP-binding protein BtuD [subsurface metagenome]